MATYSLPEKNNIVKEDEFNQSMNAFGNDIQSEALQAAILVNNFKGAYPINYNASEFFDGKILAGWVYTYKDKIYQRITDIAVSGTRTLRSARPDLDTAGWRLLFSAITPAEQAKIVALDAAAIKGVDTPSDSPTSAIEIMISAAMNVPIWRNIIGVMQEFESFRGVYPTTYAEHLASTPDGIVRAGWFYVYKNALWQKVRDSLGVVDQQSLDDASPDSDDPFLEGQQWQLVWSPVGLVRGAFPNRYRSGTQSYSAGEVWGFRGNIYITTRPFEITDESSYWLKNPANNEYYWDLISRTPSSMLRLGTLPVEPAENAPVVSVSTYRTISRRTFALTMDRADAEYLFTNFRDYELQLTIGTTDEDGNPEWANPRKSLSIEHFSYAGDGTADQIEVKFRSFRNANIGSASSTEGVVLSFAHLDSDPIFTEGQLDVYPVWETFKQLPQLGADWDFRGLFDDQNTKGTTGSRLKFRFISNTEASEAIEYIRNNVEAIGTSRDNLGCISSVYRTGPTSRYEVSVFLDRPITIADSSNAEFFEYTFVANSVRRIEAGDGITFSYNGNSSTLKVSLST